MLGTLVVGLGRAGTELHLPVLRLLRPDAPVVVFDPYRTARTDGVTVADSLPHAARLIDPANTVVHLCTPPSARVAPLTALAELGFRRVLVEKPLAADDRDLREVLALRDAAGLDLLPVGQWRASELTKRLAAILRERGLGRPRSITIVQSKPRFTRTALGDDHPSAFDVEVPHSVLLALLLAGPAEVLGAQCSDMLLGENVYPSLGGAVLRLRHHSGVRTEIRTDLTSPVRERKVTIDLDGGTVVGHFAVSAADDHAQLRVSTQGQQLRSVFRDDSLGAFLAHAYRHFAGEDRIADEPDTGAAVVELISAAKRLSGISPAAVPEGASR
ncbi:Gfo/Idh/MocA family oxidoreductase [Actinokineospora xionganensis]|uniref:Gfo/Idh/MocA family oxidoreductase n=1 Tax=Actinokineospora xionganensis TaxID=2684470 RepID=A0ABR7LGU3_9PSEU|nr:Gfo/Idh/MocA family oxidoreductase [Actinokineospora xionganensis]MBC6451507.1 Gfo/Idh/MocA family oxidoreductase [Actinokineospora xionganensis]